MVETISFMAIWGMLPPMLKYIIYGMLSSLAACFIGLIWYIINDFLTPRVIIFWKAGGISVYCKKPVKGRFIIKKCTYPVDARAIINDPNHFYRKWFAFDEGSLIPRKLVFKEDKWLDAATMTKMMNDTHIQQLTSPPISKGMQLMIIVGAAAAVISCFISAFQLLKMTGVLK